jgi:RHS repeat-associated protein
VRTLYTYDAAKRVTEIEYRDGTTFLSEVDYTYDTRGNRTQMVDPTGTTTHAYDGMNQITSVTSPGSVTVSYQYNIVGDRTRITYPDTKQVNYAYDAAHNLTSVTDWLSKVTAYAYDNAGNLTTTTLPASTNIVTTRTYDNADRLKKVENKQGTTVLSSFEYTLSPLGNRTSMLTPTEHIHYGYDSLQRLTSVMYSTPGASAFDDFQSGTFTGGTGWPAAWTTSGSPSVVNSSGAKYANMDTTESIMRSVSVSGTITRLQYRARATSLESGEFGYVEVSPDGTTWTAMHTFDTNNDDNVWQAYEHDVSAYEDTGTLYVRFRIQGDATNDDFEVDDVSVVSGSERDTYTYDAVGNRLTKNATAYTYGDADQMLTAGGTSYGYDARGNQTSRASDTFTFDHENRMTAATIGGNSASYVYNGDGVRVSKTAASVTTNYVQAMRSQLPVVLQDGVFTYVYGLGLISMTDGSGVQHYRLADGLGSTTEIVNSSGSVLVSYSYDGFGIIRAQSSSASNEWLFVGEQRDSESGYDFLRARYYDSATGRFLGRDRASPDLNSPRTLNRYAYTWNNPLNMADPTGQWPDLPDCSICSDAIDVVDQTVDTVVTDGPDLALQVAKTGFDYAAFSAALYAAGITDGMALMGCIGGAAASRSPAGCIPGGAMGYIVGRFTTEQYLAFAGIMSLLADFIDCQQNGADSERCIGSLDPINELWERLGEPNITTLLYQENLCQDLLELGLENCLTIFE